ncbi:MAG TPA: hypothetical protein VGI03_11640 [Verrucomicrobiae bacterium]|jgi:hypothetical protein
MKSSDIFGVAVRTIGLLVILYGLYDVWGGFDNFFENVISPPDSDSNTASTLSYFIYGVPEFVIGSLLFFLADWVVKLAYRD